MQSANSTLDIEEIENVWIPMSDGCRIAARLWLPGSARQQPEPASRECIT
jgi:predicted acyl esterase